MIVYVVHPEKGNHRPHSISYSLNTLQNLVGGFIETAAPLQIKEQNIEMLVDEEGALKQRPINENLLPFFFVGTAVFIGVEGDEFVSLTARQLKFLTTWLAALEDLI